MAQRMIMRCVERSSWRIVSSSGRGGEANRMFWLQLVRVVADIIDYALADGAAEPVGDDLHRDWRTRDTRDGASIPLRVVQRRPGSLDVDLAEVWREC